MGRSRAPTRRVPVKKDAELTVDLLTRAEKGDQRALASIRAIFNDSPGYWEAFGNLTTMTENVLVQMVAGDAALSEEAIRRHLETLKASLASPTPSPPEQLLIDRVAVCYLQMHDADARAARLSLTSPEVTTTSDDRTERTNASCRPFARCSRPNVCRFRRCRSTSAASK